MTVDARLATLAAMNEGTKGLRAVKLWDAWGQALARGGDLSALLADGEPRITAGRPPTRLRLGLRHNADAGQLALELRLDFAGAPRAELSHDDVVFRQNGLFGDESIEWGAVRFGSKYVEFSQIHQGVPKLMDAVYARSTFLPQLRELVDVARISGLGTAVDVALGPAQRIHFQLRHGKDERLAFERMGFDLTDARGAPFTEADEQRLEDRHGPNYEWPRGVAWRREDGAVIDGTTALFGANAKKIFPH
ncbi:hypothetical protein [Nannocystis punicea]|uniref:Uncharacterized protein n=1 Tax=Nannocystis punicea TaxID=2995304 RepID=A0ABY7GXU8_9BACT|nr:hypothetical protein [Nannocystis poenicansa]WAS91699.1 hypothetical protein O0S08_36420 [Nannocystis poenicansa]